MWCLVSIWKKGVGLLGPLLRYTACVLTLSLIAVKGTWPPNDMLSSFDTNPLGV